MLEDAIATFERQTQASTGTKAAAVASTSFTLAAYMEKLEGEARCLSAKLGVAMPQQCEGDACMSLEAYVELLEETVVTFKAQWEARGSDSW